MKSLSSHHAIELSPSSLQTTITELAKKPIADKIKWVGEARLCHIFDYGANINTHGKNKIQVLHSPMLDLHKNRAETWNPCSCEKTLAVLGIPLRENMCNSKIQLQLMQKQSGAPANTSYLRERCENLKCNITVNWLPRYSIIKSREGLEDRLKRAYLKVQVSRMSKKNTVRNNRVKNRLNTVPCDEVRESDILLCHFKEHHFKEFSAFYYTRITQFFE